MLVARMFFDFSPNLHVWLGRKMIAIWFRTDSNLTSALPMPDTRFQAMSMARWPILGPTPGRRIRPSTVSGMSPPNSCWIRAVACLMYFTFVWEQVCEFLIVEICCSDYIYMYLNSYVIYPPEAHGVDEFTQSLIVHLENGVHAESMLT